MFKWEYRVLYSWHLRYELCKILLYINTQLIFSHWVICSLNVFNFTYFSLALENLPWKPEIQTFLRKAIPLESLIFKAPLFFWWTAVPLKNLVQLCTSTTYKSVTWRKSGVLDSEDMYQAWQGNALMLVGLGINIQHT